MLWFLNPKNLPTDFNSFLEFLYKSEKFQLFFKPHPPAYNNILQK